MAEAANVKIVADTAANDLLGMIFPLGVVLPMTILGELIGAT